jgi:glycosyltransferase involved in cell wall biosynthesis
VFSNSANPNLQLYECAVQQGIESHLIECRGQIDRNAIGAIRELAVRTGADVVHAHGYKADIYAFLALRRSGIALVSTCHTWYDNDRKVQLYGAVDRFILRSYARVVAVSEEVRNRLLGAGIRAQKIHMIGNGIDLCPFERTSARVKDELGWRSFQVVGLVGRLSPEKGVDIFLQAAAQVLTHLPDVKFAVAGDGPDRGELEELIVQLGIGDSVRLLGRRDDMTAVYGSFEVMVSASRREGLPIAILEGMASSLPIVATPVGAVPSVIRDDQTGVFVATEDVQSLATGIEALLRDPARRERLGSAARRLVEEKFSAVRMTSEYLRVYAEAIANSFKGKKLQANPAAAPQEKTP